MKKLYNENQNLSLETLEDRNLLSVTLVDGDLQLVGTTGADNFDVDLDNGQIVVAASLNGDPTTIFSFAEADVEMISANLDAGDDVMTIDSFVELPSSIDGGLGNDTIFGGSGNDNVTDDGPGDIRLGNGDDQFTQVFYENPNAPDISQLLDDPTILRVDLGAGDNAFNSDELNDAIDTRVLNLDGFNVFFKPETGSLNMVQVEDLGDVRLGSNDGNIVFQTVARNSNQDTPFDESANVLDFSLVENIRVDFLDRSRSDIFVTNLTVEGDMHFQLNDGHRDIALISSNANNMRVIAGVGDNDVTIDFLNINSNLLIDTGLNFDEVLMPCEEGDLSVGGNVVVRNVNEMVTSPFNVSGNFIFDTTNENIPSILDFDSFVFIGNNLVYNGGSSTDQALLNSFGEVRGNTFVFLGDATTNADSIQIASINVRTEGNLSIIGGESEFGNSVQIRNSVRGTININFGASTSESFVSLSFESDTNQVTYVGSTGTDTFNVRAFSRDTLLDVDLRDGDDVFTILESEFVAATVDGGLGNDIFRRSEFLRFAIFDSNFETVEILEGPSFPT